MATQVTHIPTKCVRDIDYHIRTFSLTSMSDVGMFGKLRQQMQSTSYAQAQTVTAAALYGGIVIATTGTASAGFTDTTDTAANIVAAYPLAKANDVVEVHFINKAGYAVTIAGGTGVTITGNEVIATLDSRLLLVQLTNVTVGSEAVTIYL